MSYAPFEQKGPSRFNPKKFNPEEEPASPEPEEPQEYPVDTPRPSSTDYD
jgi:hypothetical protein